MPKTTTIATPSAVAPRTTRPLLGNFACGGFVSEVSAGLVSATLVASILVAALVGSILVGSTTVALVSSDFIGVSPCLSMSCFPFHFSWHGWSAFCALLMQQAEHCGNKDQRGYRGTEQ